ncbi:MAG: hypothetical protein H0X67_00975 [Acidobacteria bacterium]|nr:hypothetical protein [Acidobacteriota bacterium]
MSDPRELVTVWSQTLFRAGLAPGLSSMQGDTSLGALVAGLRAARERAARRRQAAEQARAPHRQAPAGPAPDVREADHA